MNQTLFPVLHGTQRRNFGRFSDTEKCIYADVDSILDKHGPRALSAALLKHSQQLLETPTAVSRSEILDQSDALGYLGWYLENSTLDQLWQEREAATQAFRARLKALNNALDTCDASRQDAGLVLQSILQATEPRDFTRRKYEDIDLAQWIEREIPALDSTGESWSARCALHDRSFRLYTLTVEMIRRALANRSEYCAEWFADTVHATGTPPLTDLSRINFLIQPGSYSHVWTTLHSFIEQLHKYDATIITLTKLDPPDSLPPTLLLSTNEAIGSFADLFCKLMGETNRDCLNAITGHL
ncbi:MAG: hypothetical protein ACN6PR_00170 [Achromobacter sp.]